MGSMNAVEVRQEKIVLVPIDVLWQIVEPAETLPAWLPICDRCERVSGDGLGRQQRMYVRWGRRTAEIDQQVTEYQTNARIGWTHVREQFNGRPAPKISSHVRLTIELLPAGAGTRVVLTSRNVPAHLMGALMLRLIARPRLRRAFALALENLARSGGATP